MSKRTKKRMIGKKRHSRSIKKQKQQGGGKKLNRTKKRQKGGAMMAAAGIGTAVLSGLTMAAYAGFKLINKITDKTIVKNLLDAIVIEYLPSIEVLKDKELMEHYLHCVSKIQLFSIIMKQQDLLRSRSLTKIIEDVSQTDRNISNMKEALESFDKDIQESYYSNEELLPVSIKPSRKYRDGPLHDLSNHIFETSEIFGKHIPTTVKNTSWYDVIMKGDFGENKQFELDVDELLKERKSFQFIDKIELNNLLQREKDNQKLRECLFNKMLECCTKSRGITDYIRGNITFDSSKKCVQCPNEDCLIYIYEFYYDYLMEESNISVIDRIYMLILCESRICILSKCICLEAIRIQDERINKVESLLYDIFEYDEQRNQLYILPKDVGSDIVKSESFKRVSMKGGSGSVEDPSQEDLPTVESDNPQGEETKTESLEEGNMGESLFSSQEDTSPSIFDDVTEKIPSVPETAQTDTDKTDIQSGNVESGDSTVGQTTTDISSGSDPSLSFGEEQPTSVPIDVPVGEEGLVDRPRDIEQVVEGSNNQSTGSASAEASDDLIGTSDQSTDEASSEPSDDLFGSNNQSTAEDSGDLFGKSDQSTGSPEASAEGDLFGTSYQESNEAVSVDDMPSTTDTEISGSTDSTKSDSDMAESDPSSKEPPSDIDVDELLSQAREEEEEEIVIVSRLERLLKNSIENIMKEKSKEEILQLYYSLEESKKELNRTAKKVDRVVFLEIHDRKEESELIQNFTESMIDFAFDTLLKIMVPYATLNNSSMGPVDNFIQMYQHNCQIFDFITPSLLHEFVYKDTDDKPTDQKDALQMIEAKLLKENSNFTGKLEDNLTPPFMLATIAYLHPSVVEDTELASSPVSLKALILTNIKNVIFDHRSLYYDKSKLLERLFHLMKNLSNNDLKIFKDGVLEFNPEEKKEFSELYDSMVELEITPGELQTESFTPESKKSQQTEYCLKLEKELLEKLKNKEPIIFDERMALIYNMCKKGGDYETTVKTLQALPDMLETIKKQEEQLDSENNLNNEDESIDDKIKDKEQDYLQQLSLIEQG